MQRSIAALAATLLLAHSAAAQSIGGAEIGMSGSGSAKQLKVRTGVGGAYAPIATIDGVAGTAKADPGFLTGVPADAMTFNGQSFSSAFLATTNAANLTSGALAPARFPIAAITGGTIDGVAVGTTTPAPGSFTTITVPTIQAAGPQAFKSNGTEFLRGFDSGSGRMRVWGNYALPGDTNAQTWLNNGQFVIASHGYNNGIVGYADNDLPANTTAFPTGVTGIAYLHSAGSQAFGGYTECHLTTNGVCTSEYDTFNDTGVAGPTSYPWSRAIGTTAKVSVGITVAGDSASGLTSVPSAAGIEIGQGGVNGAGAGFQFGIVLNGNGIKQWTLYQDVQGAVGPNNGIYTGYNGSGTGQIWKYGVAVNPNYVALSLQDPTAAMKWGVRQSGQMDINGPTTTTVGAAGGAAPLPATPKGYAYIYVLGVQERFAYYD